MLVWYIGEQMVSIINIDNDIKELTIDMKIIMKIKYRHLVGM